MLYRIIYSSAYMQELRDQGILKYIGCYLCTLERVKELISEAQGDILGGVDIEYDTVITDKATAAYYIKRHKERYGYIGYDTGKLNRIICVEVDDNNRDKPTAALYDHPEHGLIWLEMY